jgi:hypothetical protein
MGNVVMKHQIKIGTLFYTKPHRFQLLTGDFSWGCSMENMIKVVLGQFQATNGIYQLYQPTDLGIANLIYWYPLVNVYITMESSTHFQWVNLPSMAIFNSYVKLPEG